MVIPLGLGCHADHLVVHRVASAWAAERGVRRVYYEDLPYACHLRARQIRRHVTNVDTSLEASEVDITDVVADKQASLAFYASQLGREHLRPIHRYRRRWGRTSERLWCSAAPT